MGKYYEALCDEDKAVIDSLRAEIRATSYTRFTAISPEERLENDIYAGEIIKLDPNNEYGEINKYPETKLEVALAELACEEQYPPEKSVELFRRIEPYVDHAAHRDGLY